MIQIISDLFVNLSIASAVILLANMLMHEWFYRRSLGHALINGLLSGLFGCLLMLYGVTVAPGVFIDFRYLPVILMGLYVSFAAAVEAALIIGLFRVIYFGLDRASITALVCVILAGLTCGLIGRLKLKTAIQWLLSVLSVCLAAGTGLYFLIPDQMNRNQTVLLFIAATALVSFGMYFFIEFVRDFNRRVANFKAEAERDHLTGLKNSRHFERALNTHLESAISEQSSIALLYIDIDHFKKINDSCGHGGGDFVLKELGRILRRMARAQDVISRIGGEEFSILLVGCGLGQAAIVAERVRRAVEAHEFKLPNRQTVRVTVSIGVSSVPETTRDEKNLVSQADRALYAAKESGRNRIVIARPEMSFGLAADSMYNGGRIKER